MTRRTWVALGLVVLVSAATVGLSLTNAGAGRRSAVGGPAATRPVIFVHGFFGSGAQFETQGLRFTSNGYPSNLVSLLDYDSLFSVESRDDVFVRLDRRIAELLSRGPADKVDLLGHSLGTGLMQQYLNSTPARAAKVAHYVNLDGAAAGSPPGGVPTLAIWGRGSPNRKIVGASNVYLTNQTHVQMVSSAETFEEIYSFFTGKEPTTTDVVPEGHGSVRLAGRALLFPQNAGVENGTLEIYEVSATTGTRLDAQPEATYPLTGTGQFGPFTAARDRNYEFAIVRDGVATHHLYYEPFVRSDFWIRLLASPPTGGIGDLVEQSDRHAALTIVRYKEWFGDQGTDGDALEINGVNILNAANSPISKLAIGVFAFDAGSDGVSNVTTPIPGLSGLPFLAGVDIFMPATTPPNATVSVASTPRGGGGRIEIVNVPNWASSTDTVTIQFNDYLAAS